MSVGDPHAELESYNDTMRERQDRETIVDAIIRDVCELPDRASPDDRPDMLMVTADELHTILIRRLGLE
jgi:hypothetical protein